MTIAATTPVLTRTGMALRFAVLAAFATLLLAGCKPSAPADTAAAPAARLSAPPATDEDGWKAFLQQEIQAHDDGVTDRLYSYYLPNDSDAPDAGGTTMYGRQLENVQSVVLRTVLPGNMLAFGSPNSTRMADMIVAAFTDAKPDALKGSQVLFIGNAADNARVKAAVEASGAKYIFDEAK